MKRSGNRLLAMLLCVAMMLTLLPLTAFARWDEEMPEIPTEVESEAVMKAELPADAPEDDGQADLTAGTITPDGAVADTWAQDSNTVFGDGAVCAVENGKLHIKAGTNNANNGGDVLTTTPAMFINSTMNAKLAASSETTKTLSFDVEAAGNCTENPLFGIYLNYKSGNNASDATKKDIFGTGISVDTNGGHWFWQSYKDADEPYADLGSSAFSGTAKNSIEIKWTNTQLTSFKVNGTEIVNSAVTLADTGSTTVAFKAGNYGNVGEFYISNLHYTNQDTITTYTVSGAVKDGDNAPLDAVTVTAGSYTTQTDGQGGYSLELPSGDYTLTATKDGYTTATKAVTVGTADLPNQDMTMQVTHTVQIPMDGVDNGDWRQVANTVQPGAIQAVGVVDSKLVLTSGNTNGHKIRNTDVQTALFTSDKMNGELAASTDNTKTLSFTLVPETEYSSSETDCRVIWLSVWLSIPMRVTPVLLLAIRTLREIDGCSRITAETEAIKLLRH